MRAYVVFDAELIRFTGLSQAEIEVQAGVPSSVLVEALRQLYPQLQTEEQRSGRRLALRLQGIVLDGDRVISAHVALEACWA